MALGIDLETFQFGPANMVPRPVCCGLSDGMLLHMHHSAEPSWIFVKGLLICATPENPLVGHNIAYDLACLAAHAPDPLEMLQIIFEALGRDAVADTMLIQKLLDISQGRLRGYSSGTDGHFTKFAYYLSDVYKRHTGKDLPKPQDVRTSFGDFYDMPLEAWPQQYKDYALGDPHATLEAYEAQMEKAKDTPGVLDDAPRQVRAAFALHLCEVWGIRTDADGIEIMRAAAQAEKDIHAETLRRAGLLRENGTRNLVAAQDHMKNVFPAGPVTDKGNTQLDEAACLASGDPVMLAWCKFVKANNVLTRDVKALEQGTALPIHTRFDTLLETGRISSASPNITNVRREGGARECFVPRAGHLFAACDYDKAELHALAEICVSLFGHSSLADELNAGVDPHLAFAANMIGLSYREALTRKHEPEIKKARQRAKACFHPDTEVLVRGKGWVRIGDVTPADEVANAWPQAHGECLISWAKPTAFVRQKAPEGVLVHVLNKGIDLRATIDHRMLGFGAGSSGAPYITTPEGLVKARFWSGAGTIAEGRMPGGEKEWGLLRLAVAVQADGSYRSNGSLTLGFSKKRKIERFRKMLADVSSDGWRERTSGRVTTFIIHMALGARIRRLLDPDKTLPMWMAWLPQKYREDILDEAAHWDSHIIAGRRRYQYSTTIRKNADVLQAIAATTGRKSRMTSQRDGSEKHSRVWSLSVGDHAVIRGGHVSAKRQKYSGDVVCLSVPSSFMLVRDKGIPTIQGNCLFGFPGGLGAEKFASYAKSSYGVDMTIDEARVAKEAYLTAHPEMRQYFAWVNQLLHGNDQTTIRQHRSNRLRGGCSYTAACNTGFQGLCADFAKEALYEVARRCYAEPGNPLYGSRPVNFIHDEILLEVPDDPDLADAAARELQRVMVEVGQAWTPECPVNASVALMRRWIKGAEGVERDGKLVPWEDR